MTLQKWKKGKSLLRGCLFFVMATLAFSCAQKEKSPYDFKEFNTNIETEVLEANLRRLNSKQKTCFSLEPPQFKIQSAKEFERMRQTLKKCVPEKKDFKFVDEIDWNKEMILGYTTVGVCNSRFRRKLDIDKQDNLTFTIIHRKPAVCDREKAAVNHSLNLIVIQKPAEEFNVKFKFQEVVIGFGAG